MGNKFAKVRENWPKVTLRLGSTLSSYHATVNIYLFIYICLVSVVNRRVNSTYSLRRPGVGLPHAVLSLCGVHSVVFCRWNWWILSDARV